MKIFAGVEDLHAELLDMRFFPFGYLEDKVRNISRNGHAVS